MEQLNRAEYVDAVKAIKEAIQISRYRAAKLVNKEMLALYYAVGKYISLNSRNASYGSSALRVISDQLQQEIPGLKGFSESSLKRMRKFYEDWSELIENRPPVADDLNTAIIPFDKQHIIIRPLTVDEFTQEQLQQFLAVPFIHHYEILTKTSTIEERLFYIRQCAPIKEVSIFNVDGLLMLQTTQMQIDISRFPLGIYIIRAVTKDGQILQTKIIHK